jgi:hypothetical protein
MKTYRTIDLLKMAYDGKIFKNKFKNVKTGEIIKQGKITTEAFYIKEGANFAVGKSSSEYDFNNWLDEKWEEIPQPVSFIEAIESCKPIRVEHEYFCMHGNYEDTDHLLMKIGSILTPYQIKKVTRDGKWYIKEDEE